MAVTVKKVKLWRREVMDTPGSLAATLEPLAGAGADLQTVLGRGAAITGDGSAATIAVHPIVGKKAVAAAQQAGFSEWPVAALMVEGDNRLGLGYAIARALGDAGINLAFVAAQVIGRRFAALFGFENAADAGRASAIIKKAAAQAPPRKAAVKRR